jgi:D-3-phosphoglycerate dehydrogenase
MNILAVSDSFIPADIMQSGLSGLSQAGFHLEVRHWNHESIEALQRDNLLIEQHGPEAVQLPPGLFAGVENFAAIIVQFAPVNRRVIEQASSLKLIGVLRGGTENIDTAFATEKNVAVANTPGRNARAVAEFTIGLILGEVRNIARSHAALKTAQWRKTFPNSNEIPELFGKTVGLIGLGAVGNLVAGYLHAFGCTVIAYDPYVKVTPAGISLLGLEDVLRRSDIVSIHARYTNDTHHLIGPKEIELMKPGAILVNTARSGLVDQNSLVAALQQGRIRGAALDVFDVEPIEAGDPILALDNLTMTPHLAGSTRDAFTNSPLLFAGMLKKHLTEGLGLSIVNNVPFSR